MFKGLPRTKNCERKVSLLLVLEKNEKNNKMKCKECKIRKAKAIINNKDVCIKCFEKLKQRKKPFKTSWLDKFARKK